MAQVPASPIARSDNAVFDDAEPTSNYKAIYQYDPLGWAEQAAIGYPTATAWFANRFRARANQRLKAVSFYSAAAGWKYTYTPTLGAPAGDAWSQAARSPGRATLGALARPFQLVAGRLFSVAVRLTAPGRATRLPRGAPEGLSAAATAASAKLVGGGGLTWMGV